ncbi:MAG TPA: hypothetical protein PK737_01135 [Bacilli bacterium]|nr:hypothetical protein [Bacilli bacterium]
MDKITYHEIYRQVNIPVMGAQGLNCLLNWYLNDKKDPSRKMKLNDHQEPRDEPFTEAYYAQQQAIVVYKILKYLRHSFLVWAINPEANKDNLIANFTERFITCHWFNKTYQLSREELLKVTELTLPEVENLLNIEPDTRFSPFLKNIKEKCANFIEEHNGDCFSFPYDSSISYQGTFGKGYDYRIYLNAPLGNACFEFLSLYIQKCLNHHIPFHMKGNGALISEIDNMILYTNSTCLLKNIAVLEEIKNERPDLIAKFGSPICSGDNISYYALGHGGKKREIGIVYQTYNDYFNYISEFAYLSLIADYALTNEKIPYHAYLTINKEYNIPVSDIYKIISGYKNIDPELIKRHRISDNERAIINKLCKTVFQEAMADNTFINKYATKIKQIATQYNFSKEKYSGFMINFPICFDNNFFEALQQETSDMVIENTGTYSISPKI